MSTHTDPVTALGTPRVLIIDDNSSVLDLFRTILSPAASERGELQQLEAQLFGLTAKEQRQTQFVVDLANSGIEGCGRATDTCDEGRPYAVAFVDMRMPDWDGLRTIEGLWAIDPELQVVLCTAYSDHSWEEIADRLGANDRWLLLKKPFDAIEVLQLASALAKKWQLQAQQRHRLDMLQREVGQRMEELQRVGQTLRLISDCNDVLINSTTEAQMRDGLASRLIQDGGYTRALIGLVDDDPAAIAMTSDLCGVPPCARRIPERGANTRNCPVVAHHPEDQHCLSSITLPLCIASTVIGQLTLCSNQSNAFEHAELKLLQQLANNVAYGISNLRQGAARVKLERELEHRVNFDHLTGLPNSVLFRDRIRQAMVYAARAELHVALLVLSIERFQEMREAWGEDFADGLLVQLAQRLVASLRASDSVCRFGAQEFAISITDVVRADEVAALCTKMLQLSAQPIRVGDRDVIISTSIGVSLSTTEGDDVDLLVRNAASAARCAGAAGGQCFRFYAEGMNERVAAQLALDADLRSALDAGELVLQYQPKVHLNTGELAGAEALVRWKHVTLGMVMPGDFIPRPKSPGSLSRLASG